MYKKKVERMRYSLIEDVDLLKLVIAVNPFEDSMRWCHIQKCLVETTGREFSTRSVRERTDHLIRLFKKSDRVNMQRPGTEVEYNEREKLMQEVLDISRNFVATRKKVRNTGIAPASKIETTYSSCQDSMEVPPSPVDVFEIQQDTNIAEEAILTPILTYLQDRTMSTTQMQKRQLDLEEQKLELDEKRFKLEQEKFYLEKHEREQRLQMEMREREARLKSCETQNNIIERLLKLVEK